ncbi:MAG: replicative helicase loader/inhibitor [Eubacteriales bacterium]|nr:replicative helicase loader/inhibitor [Eubacteriales bacterium]
MKREEFKTLVKGMKAVYAQPTFIPDQDAFNVWYELLKDLPYKQLNVAIQKYMLTERFPPTIADLRAKATEIVEPELEGMSELEAWAITRKAIGNSGYHAEEEFAKLPEACQMAVGSPANLREWALMDSDQVGTVEQSHFIRNYRTAVKRISEDRKIPNQIKALISEIQVEKKIAAMENAKLEAVNEAKQLETPIPKKEEHPQGMSEETRKKLDELRGRMKIIKEV